jgi:hypothetical protein
VNAFNHELATLRKQKKHKVFGQIDVYKSPFEIQPYDLYSAFFYVSKSKESFSQSEHDDTERNAALFLLAEDTLRLLQHAGFSLVLNDLNRLMDGVNDVKCTICENVVDEEEGWEEAPKGKVVCENCSFSLRQILK